MDGKRDRQRQRTARDTMLILICLSTLHNVGTINLVVVVGLDSVHCSSRNHCWRVGDLAQWQSANLEYLSI